MKLKLHNKFEIKYKDKTYTAYNTLLKNVYNKIANLEEFTSYLALGTGTTAKSFTDTKLGAYARSYATQTEEINTDISNGSPLYIKKLVVLDDTNQDNFSFSELGITDSNSYDPNVYNHVLLKDDQDNVLTITRESGEPIEIRVTIYLELTSAISGLFVSGENKLIKRLLGENFIVSDTNIYAIRGDCLDKSNYVSRTLTETTNKTQITLSIEFGEDEDAVISGSAHLGKGETEQIFILYDGEICMRYPTLEVQTATSETKSSAEPDDGIVEVDEYVKAISSVTGTNEGVVSTISSACYSKNMSDKLTNLFDQSFTNSTTRVIAKDGKTIVFITNTATHIYKYQNYKFTKINSTLVPHSGIVNMEIYGNYIVCILNQSPYIEIFEIIDGNAVKENVNLNYYDMTSYTHDWIYADSILTESGKILVGVVLNVNEKTPLLLTLVKGQNGEWSDTQITHPTLDYAEKICTLYKNNYHNSTLCFLTSKYNGTTTYLNQEYTELSNGFNMNSNKVYALLSDTTGIKTGGRVIMSSKATTPYLKLYYAPDYDYAGDDFTSAPVNYLSYDGNYLVTKDSNNAYKIYNIHQKGSKTEFTQGFPTYVNQSQITDIDFVGDIILVFTSNVSEPVYGIALKNTFTRVEKLSDSDTYTIAYTKYDLPGSEDEGVKLTLTLNLGEEEEEEE